MGLDALVLFIVACPLARYLTAIGRVFTNFGKSLYIYFLNLKVADLLKKIESITTIIKKDKQENSRIVILEPHSSHLGKQIKSQYSKYHFQILHY